MLPGLRPFSPEKERQSGCSAASTSRGLRRVLSCLEGQSWGGACLDAFPCGHSACWPLTAAWGSIQAPEPGVQWALCGGQLLLLPAALKAPRPSLPGAGGTLSVWPLGFIWGTAGQHSWSAFAGRVQRVAGYVPSKPAGRRKRGCAGEGRALGCCLQGGGRPSPALSPPTPLPVLTSPVTAESMRLLTPTTTPSAPQRPTALEPW